ncbi:beta-glucosidase [Fennellomyces sp. T-0311]|nr:beta-glucosidase [Fennellomyces sp. T-0311]
MAARGMFVYRSRSWVHIYNTFSVKFLFFCKKTMLLTQSALLLLGTACSFTLARDPLTWDKAYGKAKDVVDRMTLEQKVGLTTGIGWEKTLCVGNTYPSINPDFPSLCLQDSPIGVRFGDNVTAGVAGITAAASFDKVAIRQRGEYMGKEFRGKGIHMQLGPSVDIMRAPQSGRLWEGFGEDPYLSGVAAAETVIGVQDQNVIATVKHYIGNNQEVHRTTESSVIDKRALHEVWLWPYARAVEAGVGAVMCSYNKVDGTYACENDYTLNTVLKGEMNFKGLVMSDWGATHSTVKSVNSGLDMTMPGDILMGDGYTYFGPNLTQAVKNGEVSEARVTDMALRIAAAYFKMGQDKEFPATALDTFHRDKAPQVPVQDGHATLVRKMAAAGTVLLRNEESILPLKKKMKKIAIIGSDAGPNAEGINSCEDRACNRGTLLMGWGSGTVDFPYVITPKEGIEARLEEDTEIVYTYNDWDTEAAAKLAADADIALVFANSNSGEEYLTVEDNNDRKNLTLWNNGDNLIQAVADANENTVVVIHSVGPVLMPWIENSNIKAIVWPGLPGQESGNSLADILFGDVNPSGRLPYTIAKRDSDYPAGISQASTIVYEEKLLVGYKWFDAHGIQPLFEFGFGLSYSQFEYGNLKVKVKGNTNDPRVIASITIRNIGDYDGAEIPQAYITFPETAGEPPKLLRGFEKVYLDKGDRKKVDFEFTKMDLSIWNEQSADWMVPRGDFMVHVGASSRDIRASASFAI